jgi:hypothetical protein
MQSEPGVADNNRMAGVGPAAVSDNNIAVLGEDIDNLPFTFVTPLESNNAMIHLSPFLFLIKCLKLISVVETFFVIPAKAGIHFFRLESLLSQG